MASKPESVLYASYVQADVYWYSCTGCKEFETRVECRTPDNTWKVVPSTQKGAFVVTDAAAKTNAVRPLIFSGESGSLMCFSDGTTIDIVRENKAQEKHECSTEGKTAKAVEKTLPAAKKSADKS